MLLIILAIEKYNEDPLLQLLPDQPDIIDALSAHFKKN